MHESLKYLQKEETAFIYLNREIAWSEIKCQKKRQLQKAETEHVEAEDTGGAIATCVTASND